MATTANHVLLRRITLSASASSVTFDSIPQTGYTDLKLVMSTRAATGGAVDMYIQFNSDSTSGNYSMRQIQGSGASASSGTGNQQSGTSSGSSDTASTFASSEIYIPNFTGSTNKSYSVDTATENNATTAYATLRAGLWSSTAAISGITLTHNGSVSFAAGSSFSLYGIADVNTTPKLAPKADGGDIIKTDGTYWYHAFLSTGSFKPQVGLTADVLVVAGGGGGANNIGGGGGAGGYRATTGFGLTSNTSYTCTVGSGGAGGGGNNIQVVGTKGGDSIFSTITATGGGYGAVGDVNGGSGGSGGGTRSNTAIGGTGNTPSTSPSQGNNGANSTITASAGGGGGASAAGTQSTASVGGNGGAGTTWLDGITYAGGGGGGGYSISSYPAGTGGTGGGGAGGYTTNSYGQDGYRNTGGGGGGGAAVSGTNFGGTGGSGIIIIRYPVA